MVFDHSGSVLAHAQHEFTQYFPQSGQVEHDAMEIWRTHLAVAVAAIAQARQKGHDIIAIGIANQRETTVLWDRSTGTPLAPAIVWQDRRTDGYCDELKAGNHETMVIEKTGLLIYAYFSGTKLKWLLDHIPGAR